MAAILRYILYPFYLFGGVGLTFLTIGQGWNLNVVHGSFSVFMVASLILLEARFPLERRWAMNWASFQRDLKYMVSGIFTEVALRWTGSGIALFLATYNTPSSTKLMADVPLIPSVLLLILGFEFLQYWFHRICHEMRGGVGTFLWRTHAAHHLPDRVYVLMHVAAHPVNFSVIQGVLTVAAVVLPGFSPESVLVFGIIMGVNGTFSHFNMDIRAGWLNYVFVSTELHRYHHSADMSESKNYGAVTPLWDLVFGTFVYKPGQSPARLGVDNPSAYPHSNEFWKVMALPFRRAKKPNTVPKLSPPTVPPLASSRE